MNLMKSLFNVVNTIAITKGNSNLVNEAYNHFVSEIQQLIDFSNVGKEELESLGFTFYKLRDNSYIMLIPIYILPAIPKGTEIKSVFGKKVVVGVGNIDLDTRGGYIAYGIAI